ncbi:MAG: ArsR family transcriptional regulator [bacterium]
MDLSKLTAEAYGSGRLEILRLLAAQPQRYTDLVRRLELSEGEVSRHLQRLHAAGLVDKLATGGFTATPLARLALCFAGALGLMARHDQYFRSHDVAALDEPFLQRLGDLAYAEFLTDPLEVQAAMMRLFQGVEGRFDGICLVAEHMAMGDPSEPLKVLAQRASDHGTRVRLLLQDEDAQLGVRVHCGVAPGIEYRTVPVSRVDLMVTGNMAILGFVDRDGRMDYNQCFGGSDARFIAFCQDYFDVVWARAKIVPSGIVQAATRAARSEGDVVRPTRRVTRSS